LSLADVESALAEYNPVNQRFVQSRIGSWLFIDDTYNANPVSMRRSIAEAGRLAAGKRLVLVLGDMLELGEDAVRAHRELGGLIAGAATTHCFYSGRHAEDVCAGLKGFNGVFQHVSGPEEVLQALSVVRNDDGVMLFKGSRGCKMEQYYSALERSWA
jgi:UDP-N-acetylmuramoyl-tripeptide--D-alanyl-D-alanine ligase